MKYLPILMLLGIILAGCSPASNQGSAASGTSSGNPGIASIATTQPSALSVPMAVTAGPPFIPVGPIQGNPGLPIPTPTPFTIKGWQTFTSSQIGVAVDFPSDWSVTEQTDGATFASPQGAQILLTSNPGSGDTNGGNQSGQQCTTLVNSYNVHVDACFDPAWQLYSAEFKTKSSGGPAQYATLSTKDDQALDVYKEMLNTLHLTQ